MTSPSSRSGTPKSFEPYGFLLTGRRRAASSNTNALDGDGSSGSSLPSQRAYTPEPYVDTTAHGKHLNAACDFVIPPQLEPVDRETPSRCRTLFVGQLRFETSAAEVRWMIKHLTGVTALKVEARGPGCFIVYLASENDAVAVRTLHRRVLMDHHGFWFARTPTAVDVLLNYVEMVLPRMTQHRKRSLHLPLDTIVVEDTRSRRIRKTSGPASAGTSQLRGPQLPPYGSPSAYPTPMQSLPTSSASSVAYGSVPASPQLFNGGTGAPTSAASTPEASFYPAATYPGPAGPASGFHRAVPEYVTGGSDPHPQDSF